MRNTALVHLTKTLSDQLGPNGITVNIVHPGVTRIEHHVIELFFTPPGRSELLIDRSVYTRVALENDEKARAPGGA